MSRQRGAECLIKEFGARVNVVDEEQKTPAQASRQVLISRAPKDHIYIRILQSMISGIPSYLATGTRM